MRFRTVQVKVGDKEESALAAYWVTDGIDRCRIGFLPRYFMKHKDHYDGRLAQVVEFLEDSAVASDREKSHRGKGVCRAAMVEVVQTPARKKRRRENSNNAPTAAKKKI